ncbi:anthranilate synthase component I family protein [Pseudalkalibacillus hwajinpoensis]|uniref:anthranilate synthase component I family protein n=1 Tax=Guptibacillus hwajinpoensis TaxID=208199 RepID=UPI001CD30AD4|nr:anthranilate synthase component I family protein [Pseudalkalibacillus hwajinpoensis]MCA0993704.1 anthranilate synthase component I family protein [Pseudalkalibacillus hwajinpoensis]
MRHSIYETIELSADEWFSRYKSFAEECEEHILLDSTRGGRYSMFGIKPIASLIGSGTSLTIIEEGKDPKYLDGNLLELMQEWMQRHVAINDESLPDFQGGAMGYLSYDIVRQIEKLPQVAADDLKLPELFFIVYEDVGVYDHLSEKLWFISQTPNGEEYEAEQRLKMYKRKWAKKDVTKPLNASSFSKETRQLFSMDQHAFSSAVQKIQAYISAGDVFQVNLSLRESRTLHSDPVSIYETLRTINPSPYMSFIHTDTFDLVSASPELLIKKKGVELSTRPIAGTRSRGKNDEEDQQLARTLIENEKERAEHVMLVDLERNDLGRVCEYGTVVVDEFMVIEKYSHVQHIVSNVRGISSKEATAFDAIKATFPGGTITGAPKIRTMEIIEELEPVRRGVYTGSIGWIGFNDDMELNIAIRTMVIKDNIAHVQAGAGIVIDSNPEAEYKESLKKARALWKAKELSEVKETSRD